MATTAQAPSLDSTIGAIEIGVLLSFSLFGATVVQLYTYYQSNFVHDSRALKNLLIVVFFLESIHTAFIGTYIYISTITNFGNYEKLEIAYWALGFSIPVANSVMVLVQGFFAYRIYVLSRKWPLTIISWFGQFIRLAVALAIAIISHIVGILPQFISQYRWLVILSFVIGAAIDILNTAALGYFLYRAKTQVKRSRKMLETLIVWTIETGFLTTVGNVIGLILLLSMPDNTAFLCLSMFLAKMYSNSLLASLNGRISLRASGAESHVTLSGMYPTAAETPQIHVAMVRNHSTIRYAGSEQEESVSRVADSDHMFKRIVDDNDTA